MKAISSMVISSRINRLLPQAMRPHYYFTVQHLAARARECQEAHGKSVAGLQCQSDEQRALMADAQYKYGVWTSAGPERAAAPGVIPPQQHEYVDKTEGLDELDTRD